MRERAVQEAGRRAPGLAVCPTGPKALSSGRFLLPPGPAVRPHRPATNVIGAVSVPSGHAVCPHRPESTILGADSAAAAPRRSPSPARPHRPRGVFCCRRATPYAPAGPTPPSSGRFLLPSGLAVCPRRPTTNVLGAVSAAAVPRRSPSPARNQRHRAAPYVPSGRRPGQMLKRERPDLDFAEKCSIFAKQRRKSYTAGGFLLF